MSTIIRIKKGSKNPYTMINNSLLNDDTISWKAKGILAYLLSLPDDWQIYETELVKHATDGANSLKNGIKELMESGYIDRKRRRNEKGHFKGYDYVVKEVSTKNGKTVYGKSIDGDSVDGDSIDGKPTTTNTNNTNTNNTNTNNTNTNNTKELLQQEKQNNSGSGPETDKDLMIIAKEYEQCGFGTIDMRTKELLEDLLEQFSREWIVQAFIKCVEANKRTISYAKGILNNWKTEGGMKLGGKKDHGGANGNSREGKEEMEYEGDKLYRRAIETYDIKPIPDDEIDF